jgi:uncharacterized protein (TIGR03435 family)
MRPLIALALCVSGSALFAQTPAPKLEFEVASVRPSATSQDRVDVGLHMDGLQVRISSFTMKDYIALAYRVQAYQVSGPDWIGSDRFDVNAKLPAGATTSQIPEMMQTLLADRFQLKFHRDKKDLPVYALSIGKPPLKLTEVPAGPQDDPNGPAVNVAASGSAAGVSVDMGHGSSYTFANNKFEGKKLTMDVVCRMLERYVDRPIVNLTDLKGYYDLTLEVTPEDYQAMLIRAAVNSGMVLPPQVVRLAEGNSASSLMDAAQKVGLKVDARKSPLDLLVVDQELKTPTAN